MEDVWQAWGALKAIREQCLEGLQIVVGGSFGYRLDAPRARNTRRLPRDTNVAPFASLAQRAAHSGAMQPDRQDVARCCITESGDGGDLDLFTSV